MNQRNIILTAGIALLTLVVGFFIGQRTTEQHEHPPLEQAASATAATEEYTCSMHPQIRQNEPGICPICEMDLTPLTANSSSDPRVLEMSKEAARLAQIETTVVGAAAATENTRRVPGKVQADERRAASLVTQVPGRIEKLYVTFTGEAIRAGQKLADIYSPELITAQRELLEAHKLATTNPQLLAAARQKLAYWKVPITTIERIMETGQIEETFPVLATAGGVVQRKNVNLGDHLREGQSLFEIINLQRVWVVFELFEEDLPLVKLGDAITFFTPALPNQTFSGKVTFINPVVDAARRTVGVRVELPNSRGQLKPEMLVYGQLQQAGENSQLMVPKSAVMWTGTRSVVYVQVPEVDIPSFEYREVELGEASGRYYVVQTGLEAGEAVVTNGAFVIDAAAQLNSQNSMMNRKVTVKGGEAKPLPDFSSNLPTNFQSALTDMTTAYLVLKNALVETDAATANSAAQAFESTIAAADAEWLEGDARFYWQDEQLALQTHTEKLLANQDVEEQRTQFDFISQLMITLLKVYGTGESTYYVQYCPMAFDDTGASWLSEEEGVLNPYFGDVMLRCGIVDEVLD